MSSEGGGAQAAAAATAVDPNLLQYRADGSQGHAYQYYQSPAGSAPVAWPVQGGDQSNAGIRSVQNVTYQYNPQQPSNGQDATSLPSTSTSTAAETDNASHTYTNYATYPTSTNPYGYSGSEYTNYYSGYQQQPTQPYTQATGTYQNSGSPYQPISSFQNPGSYAGSTSYSSTYYNPGDYQTTGAYTGSGYSNQTNPWSQGNYTNYPHQYGNYSHDSSSTYSSSNAAAATNYQQHYQQWADYYSSQTEVTCAPGTENTTVPATTALPCPIPGVSSGYTAPVSQPQASYTPSWQPENSPSALPSQQTSSTVGAYDDYWKHATQIFQNQHDPSLQSNFQKPLDANPSHPSVLDQQQTLAPQLPHSQQTEVQQTLVPQQPHLQRQHTYPQPAQQTYMQPTQQSYVQPAQQSYPSYPQPAQQSYPQPAQQSYPQPVQQSYTLPVQQTYPQPGQQSYPQSPQPLTPDTLRVSKLQIPTNPRIASNLALTMPKTIKDTTTSSATAKPAYVSVSLSNPNKKVLSNSVSDSNLKPGVFPASLRGYVERALARCKDEKQRAASQEVMKEIITKATADGTLYSRDWDIEPLFPLPDTSTVNNEQSAAPVVSMSIFKRSPSRRIKSRWEPLPEDKPIEKPISTYQDSARHGLWSHFNGRDHKSVAGKSERKDAAFSRFSTVEQTSASRSSHRPSKKQRFSNDFNAAENGDASSDSDKEQSLTAYYSGATTLANSPEEKKRRESRSKRFERVNGQRTDNRFKPKNVNSGNLYARRATALVLSKTLDDGGSRAVEDIDWDALTVKGTCQEIEKRYLRLTSAPDPATVRPEEVLEKALLMVQSSQKNYLYKCDQLKSIRQDLTVQRIRNELTVKVYETHARLALEFGDLPEFNQSQSQLKSLYGEGIEGCHMEFSAYNLLSVSLLSNNRRDLLSLMSRLSDETKKHEAVKHALFVRSAVTSGNYVLFFRLYKSAPNLNTCLMDLCVEKMRFEAVKCMSRTYRPTIPVLYVAQVLGFSNALEGDEVDVDGLEECTEWLKAHGACLIADNNGEMMVDAKVSSSSLYMPEPEDAVAHGDANLAVNDFFTRTST